MPADQAASGWPLAAMGSSPSTGRGHPRGPVGTDLLAGIEGRVRRIGVYSHHEPLRPMGSIDARLQVERPVRLVMRAPVVLQAPAGGPQDNDP
jgi:hypothetical protein